MIITDKFGTVCPIEREPGEPLRVHSCWTETRGRRKVVRAIEVEFGLRHMRGNRAPYFSITYNEYEGGRYVGGGYYAGGGHFPYSFADLEALHLSDIDGRPLHAEENGWYWLAGAAGGLGETYHGGNGSPPHTAAECLDIFANYCRMSITEAASIVADVIAVPPVLGAVSPHYLRRQKWQQFCEGMRNHWKCDADAAIAAYALPVYGDKWGG